jgi:hypothetical protein
MFTGLSGSANTAACSGVIENVPADASCSMKLEAVCAESHSRI